MLKRTPLYEIHKNLGAKIVDFGGWEMPIEYTSIIEEHNCTRENAGLFDVSHMGEIVVKGSSAKSELNKLITIDLNILHPKKIAYTFFTNEKGGVVDDLLVYMVNDEEFFLVVNASNTEKDYNWLCEHISGAEVINRSDEYGQIAIQGPNAQAILQNLFEFDLDTIGFFTFDYVDDNIISRTGYTGEDGFEIYCRASNTVKLWNALIDLGVKPIGLGARDTLRFESALPLYGHELNEDITPIEAGLKFFVKFEKCDYLGKEILEKKVPERKLVGIELIDRGIPRNDYRVEKDGKDIGYITSGTYSPTFKKGLAMALLSTEAAQLDTEVDIVIRDKKVRAKVVKLPFYNKKIRRKV